MIEALIHLRGCYSEQLEIRSAVRPVSGGLFRITKHPMRWGVLKEAAEFAILARSTLVGVLLTILVGLFVVRTRDEDAKLGAYQEAPTSS